MKSKISKIIKIKGEFYYIIQIDFNGNIFEESIKIICPNSQENKDSHIIVKNGKDTSTIGNYQQFYFKTCNRYFYGHTIRNFLADQERIVESLEFLFSNGKISVDTLAAYFHFPKYTDSRLIKRIIDHAAEQLWNYSPFFLRHRNSHVKMVDETFLTINGKTWYLVIAITEKSEILGFKVCPHQDFDSLLEFLEDCANQLEGGLKDFD